MTQDRVKVDTLVGYFEKIRWWHKVTSPTRIVTMYRCPVPFYFYQVAMEVVIGSQWISIRALLQSDVSSAHIDAVRTLVANWNQRSYRVRFLVIGDCALVQAEVHVFQLNINSFLEALAAVCRYSKLAGVEFSTLATNRSMISQFDLLVSETKSPMWDDLRPLVNLDLDFDISMNVLPD